VAAVVGRPSGVRAVARDGADRAAVRCGESPLDAVERAASGDRESSPAGRALDRTRRVLRRVGDPQPDGQTDGADRVRATAAGGRRGADLAHREVHRGDGSLRELFGGGAGGGGRFWTPIDRISFTIVWRRVVSCTFGRRAFNQEPIGVTFPVVAVLRVVGEYALVAATVPPSVRRRAGNLLA